jgi:hypothetical protein
MIFGLWALAACQDVEIAPGASGEPMTYEAPKTILRGPNMFVVMVRGNLYEIRPESDKSGLRVSTSTDKTFANVAPQDERGAADAVKHLAEEIGGRCPPPENLTVSRRASGRTSEPGGDRQFWVMSLDCR